MLPLTMRAALISEFSKLPFIMSYEQYHKNNGIGVSMHEVAETWEY